MAELEARAREWLTERGHGEAEGFDALLRDKVDELVCAEVFGPARRMPYEPLFAHLYAVSSQLST